MTARRVRATLCGVALVAGALGGCAGDVPDEEIAVSEDPLTGADCKVLAAAAATSTALAVTASAATGACAGGAVVTTAGLALPVCIVPAGAMTAATLFGVIAGGASYLLCSRAGAVTVRAEIHAPPETREIGGVNVDSCKSPSGDWRIECPKERNCGRDWQSNGGRTSDWGPCASPPPGGCTQVVLGRQADLKRFIGCPGYIGLHLRPDHWSDMANDEFVGCALAGLLGATCKQPIRVVSNDIPDYYEGAPFTDGRADYSKGSLEMCQLARCGPPR